MTRLDTDVERVALRFFEGLDTARSLTCFLLVKSGEWDQLVKLRADPAQYLDNLWSAEMFRRDHAASEFLRKCSGLPLDVDTERAAIDSFWEAERLCKRTNDRLDALIYAPAWPDAEERVLDFIEDVKKCIRRVLGPVPDTLDGRFGKGAVFESRGARRNFVLGDKIALQPHCTSAAAIYANHFVFSTGWGRALLKAFPYRSCIAETRGNRFATVAKTALTDRGICIEPGANVFLQLAVGSVIRKRLKYYAKIDLDEGQSYHRARARDGSLSGDVATIDLSSASDTVAKKLVKLLLPAEWFTLLDDLRSHKTLVDGKWVHLEKFSSMGNGFTFELETLIFWAIAQVSADHCFDSTRVSVYGDDIIVGRESYDTVISALRFFGFVPNPRKSYNSGAFRESCGGDYFLGQWVRPHYLKELPACPADWISLANGLWRVSHKGACFRSVERAWLSAVRCLPVDIRRLQGPEQLGDVLLHNFPWKWWRRRKWQQDFYKVWEPVSRRVPLSKFHGEIHLALALYGVPSSGLVPRNSVVSFRFGYQRWS